MESDRLSLIFAALADPTRRGIVTRLAGGEATVKELADEADAWIEGSRAIWEGRIERLDEHLKELNRDASGD